MSQEPCSDGETGSRRGLVRRTVLRGAALGAAAPLLSANGAGATGPGGGRRPGPPRPRGGRGRAPVAGHLRLAHRHRGPDRAVRPVHHPLHHGTVRSEGSLRREDETDEPTGGCRPAHRPTGSGAGQPHPLGPHRRCPHIAKSTGAQVIGTETTYHVLRALGVDAATDQRGQGGRGAGLRRIQRRGRVQPCTAAMPPTPTSPPAPSTPGPTALRETISDLPEGDTLAFQVTRGRRPLGLPHGCERRRRAVGTGPAAGRPDGRDARVHVDVPLSTPAAATRWTTRRRSCPCTGTTSRSRSRPRPSVTRPSTWTRSSPRSGGSAPASRVVVPDYVTDFGGDMRALPPTG